MLGDPERPFCPSCQRPTLILIATMTGERALDIYLCSDCRTQFSHEHPKTTGETSKLKPVALVNPVVDAEPSS